MVGLMIDNDLQPSCVIDGVELFGAPFEGYLVSRCGKIYSSLTNRWLKLEDNKSGYLRFSARINGKTIRKYVHRVMGEAFLGLDPQLHIDHINGNPSDNRVANLRVCSRQENQRNSVSRTNQFGFKGVRPNKARFAASITLDYRSLCLGTSDTPEDAARAYDKAALQHFGEFARLNFPE